jgi:hypothetical protein
MTYRSAFVLALLIVTITACSKRIEDKYHGDYLEAGNTGGMFQIIENRGVCTVTPPNSASVLMGHCTIDGNRLMFTADPGGSCPKAYPEFCDGTEPITIEGTSFITSTGRRFTKRDLNSPTTSKTQPQTVPSPPASASSGYELSESEMLAIMKDKGIWNMYSGVERYKDLEILRIGQFNETGKVLAGAD